MNMNINEFRKLPLVVEGESKEIRKLTNDKCVIYLKPTIYSFTHNRTAIVEGSNKLRCQVLAKLIPILKKNGIQHAYHEFDVENSLIIADLLEEQERPNIEVIIKCFAGGTTVHKYYGITHTPTRRDHLLWPNHTFRKNDSYFGPKIRFDWRNPFWNPELVKQFRKEHSLSENILEWPKEFKKECMLQDEVLPEDLANEFINVKEARKTALSVYSCLQENLGKCNIIVNDLCLFISTDGKKVFGEINQDCGRFRHLDLGSLDKDVWRTGGSGSMVLEKWKLLADLVDEL
jgi:phosphoribosylaminoimidazole-succinocarboxamide synthase